MMTGSHRLAWQSGQSAQLAEVSVAARWTEQRGLEATMPADIPAPWQTAIRFGAALFAEAVFWRQSERGLAVHITLVRSMPVDTTVSGVAYATYRALVDAVGCGAPELFRFDPKTGQFTLGR
jgi:hypothetical protein